MKRLLTCLIGLLALTTSSCALASFLTIAPKDLIDQTVNCPTDDRTKAEGFKVLSTQAWSQGVIILYSARCPVKNDNHKATMQTVLGHKVVKRNGTTWQVSGSGSYDTQVDSAPSEQLVEYGISRSSNTRTSSQATPYTILYGRVLQPKVAAVEATFDNGKVVRGKNSNGVFALLSPGATGICELRILGADNQILHQEDLAVPKPLIPNEQATLCLPTSRQI